jgi:hypothetical protein
MPQDPDSITSIGARDSTPILADTTKTFPVPDSVPEIKNAYLSLYDMIAEYNNVPIQDRAAYLAAVQGWLFKEIDILTFKEQSKE